MAAVAAALAARESVFGGGGDGGEEEDEEEEEAADGGAGAAVRAAVAAATAAGAGRSAKRRARHAADVSSSDEDDEADAYGGFGLGDGDGLARAAARLAGPKPARPSKRKVAAAAKEAAGGGNGPPAAPHARPKAGELVHAGGAGGGAAPSASSSPASSFEGLGVSPGTAAHLASLGFTSPTPVQAAVIPALLAGRDALVRAPTGSGKTLAYLVPLVDALASGPRMPRSAGTRALILLPTRELATQVGSVLGALLRRYAWLVGGTLGGGENRAHEKARLRKGVAILSATPGRLLDHLNNTSSFVTAACAWLVLDEADRLLDLGFEATVASIAGKLGGGGEGGGVRTKRQTVLLSATADARVAALGGAARMAPGALWVGALGSKGGDGDGGPDAGAAPGGDAAAALRPGQKVGTAAARAGAAGGRADLAEVPAGVTQRAALVPARARLAALAGLLLSRTGADAASAGHPARPDPDDPGRPPVPPGRVLAFFSTCAGVEAAHGLLTRGVSAATARRGGAGGAGEEEGVPLLGTSIPLLKLHGGMAQPDRAAAFLAFARAPGGAALLATDVAARGLDFPRLAAVINADPPTSVADYAHRVGRAGRAGEAGEAITLLLPAEAAYLGVLADHTSSAGPAEGGQGGGEVARASPLRR